MEEPKQEENGLWSVGEQWFATKEQAENYIASAQRREYLSRAYSTPQKRGKFLGYGKFEWAFSMIAALIVIFLFRSCTGAGGSASSAERMAERAEKRCIDSSWAWTMSQRYVKNNLRSPTSAKFPTFPVAAEHISGCTHVVVGEFEAQNGFGVMIKQRFSATMTYNKETDTWSGSEINIQ